MTDTYCVTWFFCVKTKQLSSSCFVFNIVKNQLLLVGTSFSQNNNKISLQFLRSSINYWTLSYERNIINFKNSNLSLGSGFGLRKPTSNSYIYGTYEHKEAPLFFNNSIYLKYTLLKKENLTHIYFWAIYTQN